MKKESLLIRVLVLCFVCPAITSESRAQHSAQEEPIRLKSNLVQVDVVVCDKKNHPVVDLKKEDFVLLEDGKSQQISFFSLVRPGIATNADKSDASDQILYRSGFFPEPGRFIFLILDQYHISPDNYPRLRDSLSAFISEDLSPQDQVAIISTNGKLAVFQQVTKNKRILNLAINAFLGAGSNYASLSGADAVLAATAQDINTGSIGGSPVSDEKFKEYMIQNTYRSLETIAKYVKDVPGRKIAILVSEKLPVYLSENPFVPEKPDNFSYELQRIIGLSRRGGVVIYTLDPRALTTTILGGSAAEYQGKSMLAGGGGKSEEPGEIADRLLGSRQGMMQLAAATGGFTIFNHNDLRVGLQEVLADNEAYYLLAYYPANSSLDGKFRRIRIQIKDRPDLIVRSREGYIAASEKDRKDEAKSKQEKIKQALNSLVPIRNIKVAILRASSMRDRETDERMAKVIVQIDAGSLSFKQEGDKHLTSFEVIGFAYDIRNKLVDGFSKTINARLRPEAYTRLLNEGINLTGEIKLKRAGLYNIRVVVTNHDTGETGTASEWVEAQ